MNNRTTCSVVVLVSAIFLIFPQSYAASPNLASPTSLDAGFRLLYDLDFGRAHQIFAAWEAQHPDDPLGPASDAAGLLFSEFDRLGVLESQFYTSDDGFASRKKLSPDPDVRDRFNSALDHAENSAHSMLEKDPKNRDALFALTLSSGLRSDYAALIDKRNLLSLHYTKESNEWASQVLAVDPKCYDAHLATGFTKYIVGSMSMPVRWILRIGGVNGDIQGGIAELQMTADHGRYLAPLARILLAIAYVRGKDTPRARSILTSLHDEFPKNALFVRELARLNPNP